jgi:hypothetical protein
MTVCIAATCEEGRSAVFAADRMFTASAPISLEFEPDLSKIEVLTPNCVAMGAGASLFVSEIAERTRLGVANGGLPRTIQVVSLAKDAYAALRNEKIEEQILQASFGPEYATYKARGSTLSAYLQPQPNIFQQIVFQMSQFNLGIEVLVVGCDDNASHIYYLGHPGTLVSFDKLGYNAIGSGGLHAMVALHLGSQCPHSSLAATLYAVYDAKIASEVAPGVGQKTEIAVLSRDGIWKCPDSLVEKLKEIRKASIMRVGPDLEATQKAYAEERGVG